jgi:phosphoglycerol transferase MdoB-like AlkP superfamily enzyme
MTKTKKLALTLLSLGLFFQLFLGQVASAQLLSNTATLDSMTKETKTAANLGDVKVGDLAAQIIKIALSFLAIIFLILIVIAGFKWMTASGNEEQIKKSTATIKAAVIGLIIVLAAYTITYFIFQQLPFTGSGTPQVSTSGGGK